MIMRSWILFGFMTPVSVIVTTPNSEFNPLLPGLVGFRHYDHKFEWTRAEFQTWFVVVLLFQSEENYDEYVWYTCPVSCVHLLGTLGSN